MTWETKIHLGLFVSWNINTIVTEYDLILVTTVITSESMGVEYSLKGLISIQIIHRPVGHEYSLQAFLDLFNYWSHSAA